MEDYHRKHYNRFIYARPLAPGAPITAQDLSTRRYEPNQGVPIPARNRNITLSMNRRQIRGILYSNVVNHVAPDAHHQAILDYYRPIQQYANGGPLPLIHIGQAGFMWNKGYPSIPTKTLMRETAIAGSVVFVWPERGTSNRCLQTTPAIAIGPNAPVRNYHQNTVMHANTRRCTHRYCTLFNSIKNKVYTGRSDSRKSRLWSSGSSTCVHYS
jgi:hypothetical protein